MIPLERWSQANVKQIIRELQAHLYKVAAGCPDKALVEHLWTMADVLDQYWPAGTRVVQVGRPDPVVGERE
jgi:hypothetical protein